VRNNVTFRHPAQFVPVSAEERILSVKGSDWFVRLLKRIEDLTVSDELCQEDWGVVIFAARNGKRFWIGLSTWEDAEDAWLAHVHHHSLAWVQRMTAAGNLELEHLISDLHHALSATPNILDIAWYKENEMKTALPRGTPAPDST
jgi:hypothetical protein